jgi:hypothetical protein
MKQLPEDGIIDWLAVEIAAERLWRVRLTPRELALSVWWRDYCLPAPVVASR